MYRCCKRVSHEKICVFFLILLSLSVINKAFADFEDGEITEKYRSSIPSFRQVDITEGDEGETYDGLINFISPESIQKASEKYDTFGNNAQIILPCLLLGGISIAQPAYNHFDSSLLFIAKAIGAAVLGVEMGDLLSGLHHATLDNIDYRNKSYPLFLRTGAYIFQAHHKYPKQVTKASYWMLTRISYKEILLPLVLTAISTYSGYDQYSAVVAISLLTFAQDQFVHACTHGKKNIFPPLQKAIKWLQNHPILLNPRHHARHHKNPTDEGFCGVTGHMDVILNPIIRGIKSVLQTVQNFRRGH